MDVYSGASTNLTVTFLDTENQAVAPITGQYRVLDGTSGNEIFPWTDFVSDSSEFTILISAETNTIVGSGSKVENRIVQVAWEYLQGSQVFNGVEIYSYYVREVSTISNRCSLFADMISFGCTPKKGALFVATPKSNPPQHAEGVFIDGDAWEAETDTDGRATLILPQNTSWSIMFEPLGWSYDVNITDETVLNFKDVVFKST